MPPKAVEELVCGLPNVDIRALKRVARYRDLDPNHKVVVWLWEILESMAEEEKVLFVVFISGRSRLPVNPADLPQRFQVGDMKEE